MESINPLLNVVLDESAQYSDHIFDGGLQVVDGVILLSDGLS